VSKDETDHDLAMQDWHTSNPDAIDKHTSKVNVPAAIYSSSDKKRGYSLGAIVSGLIIAFCVWFAAEIPFLIIKAAVTGDYKIDAGSAQTDQHPALANVVDIIGWIVSLALALRQFIRTMSIQSNHS
jgi:hypothetical protein